MYGGFLRIGDLGQIRQFRLLGHHEPRRNGGSGVGLQRQKGNSHGEEEQNKRLLGIFKAGHSETDHGASLGPAVTRSVLSCFSVATAPLLQQLLWPLGGRSTFSDESFVY